MKRRDRNKPLRFFIVPYNENQGSVFNEFLGGNLPHKTLLLYAIVATYPRSAAVKIIHSKIKSYSGALKALARHERVERVMPKPKEEVTKAEKIIIRNQRYIMLALACLHSNIGGMASGGHAERLRARVVDMERAFPWIASPSERIS